MKMLLVENDPGSILHFTMTAKNRKWDYFDYALKLPAQGDELHRFLKAVSQERPDVVIIDIALDSREETLIDDVSLESAPVPEDLFSGFKYCRAIVKERWNIPIVILTKIKSPNVTRAATKVGADLVLVKQEPPEPLLDEIVDLVRSRAAHDPNFYWQLSDDMTSGLERWERSTMNRALDRFFLNASNVRRFSLFTASLKGILSPFFARNEEGEKKLMLGLVKSQVLLSLVDPQLRDHVKHTGNVFWMGYSLMHQIAEFRKPHELPGYVSELYDSSGPLKHSEQLFYAWTLAALFHDYGYVDERQSQLKELVASLLPSVSLPHTSVREEPTWNKNMSHLMDFVSNLLGPKHFLCHFIDSVKTSFGCDIECRVTNDKKAALLDHGFFSAHRLLNMIPLEDLDAQQRNIVLHAALAIAYHNYTEMLRKWRFGDECRGQLSMGTFPVCSLLAFCDILQTWDRETEVDPAITRVEAYDNLLERLVLSDTAYISGSEIREFSTCHRTDGSGYDLSLKLRYFVEASGGVEEVCENLGVDIQKWIDSGRIQEVCNMTGLSSLLHGRVVYQLPMFTEPRVVTF